MEDKLICGNLIFVLFGSKVTTKEMCSICRNRVFFLGAVLIYLEKLDEKVSDIYLP